MFEDHRERLPKAGWEQWFFCAFVALLIGLFGAEIASDFRLVKLTPVFFLLAWIPLLVVHEFAHAIVARVFGWYVGRIVIGFGKTARTYRFGETQLEIRWFPFEGFVACLPRNLNWPRTKNALIYFAGPGVELLIAGLIVVVIGWETLLSSPTRISTAALQGIWVAALTGAVLNLVPHSVASETGRVPNDGLGILQSFFRPDHYFADQIGTTYNPSTKSWDEHDSADWWKR